MIFNIVGLVIGIMILGAGIYYLLKAAMYSAFFVERELEYTNLSMTKNK